MRLSVKLATGFAYPRGHENGIVWGSVPATNQRVPHISLVFREMWDTQTFMFLAGRAENRPVERRGIPHLAKNERDVGHP